MSLPPGFRVALTEGVLVADDGRLLIGGTPLTALRLSTRALGLIEDGGVTVADGPTRRLAERLLATNLGVPDLDPVNGAQADDLTVVIPVRDRQDQLDRALATLAPLRCIVVDDASRDPGLTERVARSHRADLIALAVNEGPAGARNAGLRVVTTPYVAFLDCDVEVRARDLLALTRHFADPSVAMVGPRVAGVSRSPSPRWFERYELAAPSLSLGRTHSSVRPGAAVAWLPSACLVARTAALVDGFAADLRVGEDVDLVWRLVAAGHRVRYDPTVDARHETRPTIRAWLGRKAYYGSGGAGLVARHGNLLAPAVLTPAYALAAAAILLRNRWSLPIAAGAVIYGTQRLRTNLPTRPAVRVATRGLTWAVRQESALALRHWWPAMALAAIVSGNARRALTTALVVDAAVALAEHRHPNDRLNPAILLAGRRLDDLAYGAGLWVGALRHRSLQALTPRRPGHVRRP